MAQKSKSDNKKVWAVRIGLAVLCIAALLISLIWADAINAKFGLTRQKTGAYNEHGGDMSTAEVLEAGGDLNVHFVDVGQGDACIIELPDDKTMLIDAGETDSGDSLIKYIKENINKPSGEDIEYFDYVILTHPDSDHCGEMADVLAQYPAKVFYRPNVYSAYNDDKENDDWLDPEKVNIRNEIDESDDSEGEKKYKDNEKTTRAYDRALKAAYEGKPDGGECTVLISDATDESISVIKPEGLGEDDPNYYTFTFYAPVAASYKDNNNYSPVMILDYHGKRFMLSGDAEKEAEADFVAVAKEGKGKYAIFDESFSVDVFKLGHHGSRTSSSEDMIRVMTTPANRPNVIAIVSCGEDNSYGHPHSEVIDRLAELGFDGKNIVRTDENGTVAMAVKGVKNENGTYTYELMMGAETVKYTAATIGNDKVHLTWSEIVILGILVVIAVLIVTPAVKQAKKKARKAAREAGIDVKEAERAYKAVTNTSRSSNTKSRTSRSSSSNKSNTKKK